MSKIIGNPVGTTLPKPNWDQNDPTQGDYIKNRTHYETSNKTVLIPETTKSSASVNKSILFDETALDWTLGNKVNVIFDGNKYEATCINNSDDWYEYRFYTSETGYIGFWENGAIYSDDKNFDFSIGVEHTFEVYTGEAIVKQLDEKFIPDTIARTTYVDEQISGAISEIPQPDWNQNDETASDYIKNKPFIECYTVLSSLYVVVDQYGEDYYMSKMTYEDKEYIVLFDGVEYVTTFNEAYVAGGDCTYLGSPPNKITEDLPFSLCVYNSIDFPCTLKLGINTFDGEYTHDIKIVEKTIKLDPKYIPDSVKVNPDWNQNDETADDYIKNRPFYESEPVETHIVEETTVTLEEDGEPIGFLTASQPLETGQEYIVTLDGVQYNTVCKSVTEGDMVIPYLGNLGLMDSAFGDTGETFVVAPFISETELGILNATGALDYTVSITGNISEIHHINPKYIKDMYYEYIGPNIDFVLDDWFVAEEDNWQFDKNDFMLESFLVEGATYIVNCNDEIYTCTARRSNYGRFYIGNQAASEWSEDNFTEIIESNEPFFLWTFEEEFDYGLCMQTAGEYAIFIQGIGEKLTQHKIDMKYMPDNIIYYIRDHNDSINDLYSNINSVYNKMDKENPSGTGSFSMNRKSDTAIGDYSIAIGYNTTASGNYSHAEGKGYTFNSLKLTGNANSTSYKVNLNYDEIKIGRVLKYNDTYAKIINYDKSTLTITTDKTLSNTTLSNASVTLLLGISHGAHSHAEGSGTTASGDCSHAEGSNTTASGEYSHAEGWKTEASGKYSHAGGSDTEASGLASHAEGVSSTASGTYSHAEGIGTEASGRCSHAEGNNTIASGQYQHVQGVYNIEDTENKYAHIVGNGEEIYGHGTSTRSNAHTLDWNGNAWYQGEVKIGGTGQDDEAAKTLATTEYVDAVKNDLLNGAGAAYDTLKELGNLIDENVDAIEALETVATGKADKEHGHEIEDVTGFQEYEFITVADIDEICGATLNI